MRLYIAEKPSMGREIAKILGAPVRKGDGFLETPNGVVTWGFGHILRQAEPEEYDEKYKKWRTEDLPIVPREWKLMVAESCRKQFGIVKGLIERADEIVHAGDPDREGQLLIDEVLEYVGNKKPVLRILLNALDEKSIREANADLRDNKDFAHLKESALARARADWLIGMNLSRAYTLAARRAGHDMTLPIGRVKTPTLALVVRREREIKDFHPVAYYTIKANFNHENGSFDAVWKPKESQKGLDSEGRLVDKAEAESMLQAFASANTDGVISSYQTTAKKEPQRLPFSERNAPLPYISQSLPDRLIVHLQIHDMSDLLKVPHSFFAVNRAAACGDHTVVRLDRPVDTSFHFQEPIHANFPDDLRETLFF